MTRVLYIAPEYPASGENAAQVRANALLPRLRQLTDLRILAFPPHGKNISSLIEPGLIKVSRAEVGSLQLAAATLSSRPRAFLRYDTDEARKALQWLLDNFNPDVVHFDSIGTMALLDVVKGSPKRAKIVAHTHDAVSQLYKRQLRRGSSINKALTWFEYRKYLDFERHKLPATDVIIVDSPEDAEFLSCTSKGSFVSTIPLGVDLQLFSKVGPVAALSQPALVFSGSMAGPQSADAAEFLVNEVMPLVWARRPNCNLYLVGNRPLPEIKSMASDRVHVTGFVEDLPAYLRAAAVYVCPLRIGSGMRTRVVEALACGAPMVATSMALRGLNTPQGSENAPWIVAETARTFASGIESILSGDYPSLSMNARVYVQQNYSWDAVVQSLLKIYREIGVA